MVVNPMCFQKYSTAFPAFDCTFQSLGVLSNVYGEYDRRVDYKSRGPTTVSKIGEFYRTEVFYISKEVRD